MFIQPDLIFVIPAPIPPSRGLPTSEMREANGAAAARPDTRLGGEAVGWDIGNHQGEVEIHSFSTNTIYSMAKVKAS